ncbi:glycerate kinase [Propionibacterium cyclohexanicum]|uniref:Glycerate kinase n=1 Tax=Propionibacterium cyclohexanicum TaxID=64702 RepID=A0A1H9U6D0_9ACTN|nr:glycerate kinase [Propionibacterium cyclohexanicum]SES04778.1 glycerate kinase [Propionibacterium cyclohexanicum]
MTTYVLAPDSFKESLSALEAARAMERGVHDADPAAQAVSVPMADGGEGFAEVLGAALGAQRIKARVHDALGRPIEGAWWLAGRTAVIDVATAVGLGQIPQRQRNVMASDSTGVGELIAAALDHGANEIIIGLGGSATNDGGAGMLRALGARFLDSSGQELSGRPQDLSCLASIDTTGLDARLGTLGVRAACDVNSPLLGPTGASAVFGPQKGATATSVERLDSLLATLSRLAGDHGRRLAQARGSGAAGGLGWALMTFLDAQMRPGVEVVIEATELRSRLRGATALFTGEGSVDAQSVTGKTVSGLASAAADAHLPVVVFAGRIGEGAAALHEIGVTQLVQITPREMPLAQALPRTAELLRAAVARSVRTLSWQTPSA